MKEVPGKTSSETGGVQGKLPQDVPVWRANCLDLKTSKTQKTQEVFEVCPYCLKEFQIEGLFQEGAVNIGNYSEV